MVDGAGVNIADVMQGLAEELEARLRVVTAEERRLAAEHGEVRDARLRQEGALDCWRLIARRLAESGSAASGDGDRMTG